MEIVVNNHLEMKLREWKGKWGKFRHRSSQIVFSGPETSVLLDWDILELVQLNERIPIKGWIFCDSWDGGKLLLVLVIYYIYFIDHVRILSYWSSILLITDITKSKLQGTPSDANIFLKAKGTLFYVFVQYIWDTQRGWKIRGDS